MAGGKDAAADEMYIWFRLRATLGSTYVLFGPTRDVPTHPRKAKGLSDGVRRVITDEELSIRVTLSVWKGEVVTDGVAVNQVWLSEPSKVDSKGGLMAAKSIKTVNKREITSRTLPNEASQAGLSNLVDEGMVSGCQRK